MTGQIASSEPFSVQYRVNMTEPWTHTLLVEMRVSGLKSVTKQGKVAVSMPVWTPGSYLVRDFPRNILTIEAKSTAGRPLPVEKESKSRWVVTVGNGEEEEEDTIIVTYRVYAFAFGTNSSYIDVDHAMINGASVFLYAEDLQGRSASVELVPHKSWGVVSTGLDRASAGSWIFVAPNYDVLVDSPIEIGNQHVSSFEVSGTTYDVSIFAQKPVDEGRLVSDLKKIVQTTVPIFQDVPYKRYVFLIDFVGEGFGGLEHLNSTYCIGSYYALEPPEEYRSFLSLFSHEFLHAWNVKRMRPVALGPFDYSRENYTKSLWVAEGITSYYQNVILRRAGIFSIPEFLEHLAEPISYVKSLPSGRVQTPEESSFDSWVRHYRQDENSPNVSPSYYRQGAVLGTLLDLEIRRSSQPQRTLDDVMRTVYWETYQKGGRGYTDEEFERACADASGGQTAEIFSEYVHDKREIDYSRYLGYVGLQLAPKSAPSAGDGFLGIRIKSGTNLTVLTRLTGSPAELSDIAAGDEILATDGLRTDAQKLQFYIANRPPGTDVDFTIARSGILKVVRVRLGMKPVFEYRIVKRPTASDEEKRAFASWTNGEWDEPLVYKEHRASPIAVRNFDYL